jgi:hypothetical protein
MQVDEAGAALPEQLGDERRVRGDLAKSDEHGVRSTSPRFSHVALRQIAPHPSLIAV